MRVFKDLTKLPTFRNAVVTIGSFDGVHIGHQQLLKKIKAVAKEVDGEDVVITFYPHPRMVVNPADKSLVLLNELDEKLMQLEKAGVSNCVIVPFTIEFSQQSPESYIENFIIKSFNPSVLVIGYDHKFGHQRQGEFELLEKYKEQEHFDLIKIDKEEIDQIAISSTKIRNALLSGLINKANKYLGYNYFISGQVVHGEKIGSKLGFPTANIKINTPNKLIPKIGIYSCKLKWKNSSFNGMMYIGQRPSINDDNRVGIEVHIFDFNESIYGEDVQVEFINHIRDDIKFDTLGQLSEQLQKDEIAARADLSYSTKDINNPKIGVVVLNYNGTGVMKQYLSSLYDSCVKHPFDLVVIDNGSTDDSIVYLKEHHPKVKLVQLKNNLGFAGGYNEGLSSLNYDYIALVNSDIEGTSAWLDPLIDKLMEDASIGVIQPKIKSWSKKDEFEYAGAGGGYMDHLGYPYCRGRIFDSIEKDNSQYDEFCDIDWASGCAFVTRGELFKHLDGFDSSYFAHMEEIDLCLRAKRYGYRICTYNFVHVYHLGGGTLEYESPNKTFLNFRNNLSTILKNSKIVTLFWVIPLRLILDGVAGLKFLMEGRPKSMWAIVRAHFNFYGKIPDLLKKRKHLAQSTKRVQTTVPIQSPIKSILFNYYILRKKKFSDL